MNAKLLFLATVALSVASTLALADESRPVDPHGLTRADVVSDYQQSRAAGTLQRTDHDYEHAQVAGTALTRAQVVSQMSVRRDPRLVGPFRSGLYNPYGASAFGTSDLTRADVKAGVLDARHAGTLHRTDYDDVPAPRAVAR